MALFFLTVWAGKFISEFRIFVQRFGLADGVQYVRNLGAFCDASDSLPNQNADHSSGQGYSSRLNE